MGLISCFIACRETLFLLNNEDESNWQQMTQPDDLIYQNVLTQIDCSL